MATTYRVTFADKHSPNLSGSGFTRFTVDFGVVSSDGKDRWGTLHYYTARCVEITLYVRGAGGFGRMVPEHQLQALRKEIMAQWEAAREKHVGEYRAAMRARYAAREAREAAQNPQAMAMEAARALAPVVQEIREQVEALARAIPTDSTRANDGATTEKEEPVMTVAPSKQERESTRRAALAALIDAGHSPVALLISLSGLLRTRGDDAEKAERHRDAQTLRRQSHEVSRAANRLG